MRFPSGILILGSCMVLLSGCGESKPIPAYVPVDEPVASSSRDGESAEASSDQSLSPDDYLEAGMPAHDRVWSGKDMAKVSAVLREIAQKNASHLPRRDSRQSGEVFARITADENLILYRNRSLPIEMRLPEASTYMHSSNELFMLYLSAYARQAVGDAELLELMGAQLRLMVVMVQLMDEFFAHARQKRP